MAIEQRGVRQIFSSMIGPDLAIKPSLVPNASDGIKTELAPDSRQILKNRRLSEMQYAKDGRVKEALGDMTNVLRERGFEARVITNYKEKGDPDFKGKRDQESDLDRPEVKIDKPYELGVAFGIPGDTSKSGIRYGAQVNVRVARNMQTGEIEGLKFADGLITQPPGDPERTPEEYESFAIALSIASLSLLKRMHSRTQPQPTEDILSTRKPANVEVPLNESAQPAEITSSADLTEQGAASLEDIAQLGRLRAYLKSRGEDIDAIPSVPRTSLDLVVHPYGEYLGAARSYQQSSTGFDIEALLLIAYKARTGIIKDGHLQNEALPDNEILKVLKGHAPDLYEWLKNLRSPSYQEMMNPD